VYRIENIMWLISVSVSMCGSGISVAAASAYQQWRRKYLNIEVSVSMAKKYQRNEKNGSIKRQRISVCGIINQHQQQRMAAS